jgi:uncharacterized Zn finger protein
MAAIPVWMTDRVACAALSIGPVLVSVEALTELASLVNATRSAHDRVTHLPKEDHDATSTAETTAHAVRARRAGQNLKNHGSRIDQWPAWREKALSHLRERIDTTKRDTQKNRWGLAARADCLELVRVFLWEKDIGAAWREAQSGGCSNDLWLQLAARREKDHPEDALPIYRRQIEPTLARTNNEAYREAIGVLRKVRALLVQLDKEAEFTEYLQSVCGRFKAKRNFIKLLGRAQWS